MEDESEGARLIAAERQRQVESEGWTPEHDAIHTKGELAGAAVAYVQLAAGMSPQTVLRYYWPWDAKWLKPANDPIRELVKAGALIAAEIDRIQRDTAEAKAAVIQRYRDASAAETKAARTHLKGKEAHKEE